MIKTVIFDMDGVLIDSIKVHYLAWKKLFESYGIFTRDEFTPIIGVSTQHTAEILKSKYNASEDVDFLINEKDRIYLSLTEEMKLYPQIPQILEYLKKKNITLVVATSEHTDMAKKLLTRLSIKHFFANIVGRDQVIKQKPAPDLFLKAAEVSNSLSLECIVIEDSVSGVKAGKNAGMKVICVTTTTKPELLRDADIVTDDLLRTLKTLDFKQF